MRSVLRSSGGVTAALVASWTALSCGGGGETVIRAVDTAGMVAIPTSDVLVAGESVRVESFWIDAHEVSNDEFARFVAETGFVSEAERIGNSVVFSFDAYARGEMPFSIVDGACWNHPSGPDSDLEGKGDHPAVHISWNDAVAYAEWCGKRLPTRAEWIAAARGGLEDALYPWGDELRPEREHRMNAWQGVFPVEDHALDGFRGTAPVGSFPANAYGVHDLSGNVWEWTSERRREGDGPEAELAEKRGGSFLCRERAAEGFHACRGYRVSSYEWSPIINGNDNIGFRCAASR